MKIFEKIVLDNRNCFYIFGKRILRCKIKHLSDKPKIEILRGNGKGIGRFIRNIGYLFKYDLKQMYEDPNINIGQVTELAAIKTKFIWNEIKSPKIKSDMETINELVNTNKSIIRFGDGEMAMMLGRSSLFEKQNKIICDTFNEIFYKIDENLLTGTRYDMFRINTNFINSGLGAYRLQYLLSNYENILKLHNMDKTYYSACFIYPFVVYSDWNVDEYFKIYAKSGKIKKLRLYAEKKCSKILNTMCLIMQLR